MTLDYQYIDPGPDDPGYIRRRYFALNVSSLSFSCKVYFVKFTFKGKKTFCWFYFCWYEMSFFGWSIFI